MYTSTIGRVFLNAYNAKHNANYSAESFFKEIFVPLFFDHPKYMMTAGNSPLENPKISWDDMIRGKKPWETKGKRAERIDKMYAKIEAEGASDTLARGFPVASDTAATSGQKSGMQYHDNKDDVYLSWIGDALSIGVSGGISILFNHPDILLDIFEGWKYYRQWLQNIPMLKGLQINTWNGRWISHRYDSAFKQSDPMFGFNPLPSENKPDEIISIPTISWVKVILRVSLSYPIDSLVGYLYSIGKANATIGFIPFKLSEIRNIKRFYEVVFSADSISFSKYKTHIEELFGTAYGIQALCQNGSIGVKALEPIDLKKYLNTGKKINRKEIKDELEKININLFKIWILAMLNNERMWELSQKVAKLYLKYESGAGKTRTDRMSHVNNLLASRNKNTFMENMTVLMKELKDEEDRNELNDFCQTVCIMPRDNFYYLNILIGLEYAYFNH